MDLEPSTLFAGLLVSGVGFVLFRYGKHMLRVPQMVAGVAMMVVPFFAGGAVTVLAVGGGVVAALWLGVRLGL